MTTVLDELAVRALVPRDDPMGPAAGELLRRACGEPLVGALDVAAEALRVLDPGAYWVIRELGVHVTVPASETDPVAQARRLAAALVAAIERMVRLGPDPDVVRFAGAGDYGASFVRSILAGAHESWVYRRLAGLRGLRPADAIVAVAAALQVPPLEVFAALATTGDVARLLRASSPAGLDRLAGALREGAATTPVPHRLLDVVRAAHLGVPVLNGFTPPAATARGLDLLARLIVTVGATQALVAAVFAVVDARAVTPLVSGAGRMRAGDGPDAAGRATAPSGPGDGSRPPWTIAAPGAIAFQLLPDLSDVMTDRADPSAPARELAGGSPAAAAIRCEVLATVLGPSVAVDDPALGLAAGLDPRRPPAPDAVAALRRDLGPWADALAADPRSAAAEDGDWFSRADPVTALLASVLLRRFAGHLTGFGRAPARYLAERVLPPGGVVVVTADALTVTLPPAPLQIVLALAGLDAFVTRAAWLDRPVMVTHGGAG